MSDRAADIQRAAAVLAAAERIVTTGHIRPDGDALGSMLALATAARSAGKTAVATFGEPHVVAANYDFLDRTWLVHPDKAPDDIDVLVVCDTAVADRLGSVAPLADRAGTVLVIDHHLSAGGLGDVKVVDPTAAATTQLVYHLILELGWKLSTSVATALYMGLVTDTGRFQYSNTSSEVHQIAATLIEAGVRPADLSRHLYESSPFGYLSVVSAVTGRAVLERSRSLVWSVLYDADLKDAGIGSEDADALIDEIRIAREAEVACLLKQVGPSETKGSLRSRGLVDVAAVAEALGGGGHHNAAGFTCAVPPEEAIELVRRLL